MSVGVAYHFTDRGSRLAAALAELGRWGSELLEPVPRPGEIVSAAAMIRTLELTFAGADPSRPPQTATIVGPTWQIDVRISEGRLATSRRSEAAPPLVHGAHDDLVIDFGLAFGALISFEVTMDAALAEGRIRILNGTRDALARLLGSFVPVPDSVAAAGRFL